MTTSSRFPALALGLGCIFLAACSGGTTGPSTPKLPAATPTPTVQNVAKASGTLTIKFSHIKEHMAAIARKRAGAGGARRSPKFVDPASGSYLEIASWGSCQNYTMGIYNFNTMAVVPLNAGNDIQTATVPIVADNCGATNVYVYEVNESNNGYPDSPPTQLPQYSNASANTDGDVIAYGEGSTNAQTSPGSTVDITVTMSIAPYQLGMAYEPSYSSSGTADANYVSDDDSYPTFQLYNYFLASSSYAEDYGFAVAADFADSIDDCYFATTPVGAGSMPQITLASQQPEGFGSSYIGQVATGAWVLYYDGNNPVDAVFQTTVPQFPIDGPYAAGYTAGPGQEPPIIYQTTTSGWITFTCGGYCTVGN